MNKADYQRSSHRVDRMQALRLAREHDMRGDLRMRMQSMSRFGRDVARTAMSRNDEKERPRARESGFHVDAYSNDRSNRETSRDERGRRRRD